MIFRGSLGPYAWLARFSRTNKWWVLAVTLVVTVAAGVVGLPPAVNNDILAMMPDDDPVIEASKALNEEGGVGLLTIGLVDEGATEEGSEKLGEYAEKLAGVLEKELPDIDFVFHKIDNDLAYRLGLFQLDPDDVRTLTSRLRGAVALGPALNPLVAQRLLDMGETTERLAQAQDASLIGKDGRTRRIVVRTTRPAQDKKWVEGWYPKLEKILEDNPADDEAIHIAWLGGPHRHIVEDTRTIGRDLGWTTFVAAGLVLLIIALAFRDLRAIVIVFSPILIANVWTLGILALVVGHLNTFTSAGVPILIGLGIDFAIHLYGRYRELRDAGADQGEALERGWTLTGPPSVTAGLTSAGGFLALVAAAFQGFAQIGIMLAFGILACLVAMLVLLPALIAIIEPKERKGKPLIGANLVSSTPSSASYQLAPPGLMVAVLVTGVMAAVSLPRLQFDYDMSSMRAEGSGYEELSEVERELAEGSFAPMVVSYDTKQALRGAQERFERKRDVGDLPFVGEVLSVENLIPSDGNRRLEELLELVKVMREPNVRYVHSSPARPIIEALMPLREMKLSVPTKEDLPKGLYALAGGHESDHRLLVFPDGNVWDMRNALKMLHGVRGVAGEDRVAGPVAVQGLAYEYTQRDFIVVGTLALVLVSLLALIDLKKPLFWLGAVGTLIAGMAWAGVVLSWIGLRLSIVNVIGIPILLGIGVDVVIHLLHRLQEEGPGGVRRAWMTTGVAALVSTSTTVASFGALLLASSRGIQSLGLLVVVGLTTITLIGAMFLPLAWAAGWRITGQAPAQKMDEKQD